MVNHEWESNVLNLRWPVKNVVAVGYIGKKRNNVDSYSVDKAGFISKRKNDGVKIIVQTMCIFLILLTHLV